MSLMLSRDQQKAILERLYHTRDSISALEKFRGEGGLSAGDFAQREMRAFDVMHTLKKVGFKEEKIKKAMAEAGLEQAIIDL